MALQGPFFGKRESEPLTPRNPSSSFGSASSLGSAGSTAGSQAFPASSATASTATASVASAPAHASDSGAKLTVGPNIKLKGVEITDCDTLVVEGTVEATMNSRVIQISEQGAFKGSAVIDIAEVRGIFEGNLTVREKLVIFSTGKVTGKIRYGKIVIEEGGQLSGEITFGTAESASTTASTTASSSSTPSGAKGVKGEQISVAA